MASKIGTMARASRRNRTKSGARSLPLMLAETLWWSLLTIGRRSQMMASGQCTAVEYQRMAAEKIAAARDSAAVLLGPRSRPTAAAVLAPWHRRVKANARRLSRS
jgi:hypothetical protein